MAKRNAVPLAIYAVLTWACAAWSQTTSEVEPSQAAPLWDTFSDTWVAADALGRQLPGHDEVGLPRADRTVGIFYFLWLGAHAGNGPYDVSKVLAEDPTAIEKRDSPLWGPLGAMHHWGEPLFGYYRTDDAYVLRKHAQMLADAGVDVVIFDVTNQWTYKSDYRALLRVFSEVRRDGGKTPHVAFLCPFWKPAKVVAELYQDLYEPGLDRDLWFRWEGKPLILADPALIADTAGTEEKNTPERLEAGHRLGQSFTADKPFDSVGGCFPTWRHPDSGVTLTLFRDGPQGEKIACRVFADVEDNAVRSLEFPEPLPPGAYYLEISEPKGVIGWWSHTDDVLPHGQAFADGRPGLGDRVLRVGLADEVASRLRKFFTFRKPQADYFRGPTGPDMWSWLEVYPQHVFKNARGEKEQMSVGVGQNAVDGRLGSMSEPGSRGRSFHRGAVDASPGAVLRGHNLAEQWERALKEDPRFIFVTGWNEWIASRFDQFAGVHRPVMFVDQFDQEHSRDIEPMNGGHGDNYYYQLAAFIRRYKGVRPRPAATARPITIDGRFDDWNEVAPEYRDTIGDPARRNHPGYGHAGPYVNTTGRNDLVAAKVSWDARNVYFYIRTRQAITPPSDPNWMMLLIDADHNSSTGWLGYDLIVNRLNVQTQTTTVERHQDTGSRWGSPVEISYRMTGNELELAVPRAVLGITQLPAVLDFKWADNIQQTGDAGDFTLNGDVGPNDRYNYRAVLESGE